MSKLANPKSDHGSSLFNYIIGYGLSLYFTITAYLLVTRHILNRRTLIAAVVSLALAQFLTQMYFFLHLGRETKPRWKLFVFLFMLVVVLILVFGSLWIMTNLDYRMTPQEMLNYLHSQDAL